MSRNPRNEPGSPEEAGAVRTTIVGGRPPGSGQTIGDIPRGVEILIKKAAVDPAFKKLLIEKRAAAAEAIALTLSPAEQTMLEAVPEAQLRAIVANTKVSPGLRPAFLGYAAGVMLAALGGGGCKNRAPENTPYPPPSTGINPDYPPHVETAETAATGGSGTLAPGVAEGVYAGGNKAVTGGGLGGIRPDSTLTKRQGKPEVTVVDVVVVPPAVGDPARNTGDVERVVKTSIPDIRSGYVAALENDTGVKNGKITIVFNIKADGSVYDVGVVSGTIGTSELEGIVVEEAETWRFPALAEGAVSAAATFIFTSGTD